MTLERGRQMETYKFLLDLALILLSTKVLGLITRRFHMPQVVGALIAGLLLGPVCFNVITQTEYIQDTSEIGVIILMFCAGLETDVHELKRSGKSSCVIALLGVLVPLAGGYLIGKIFILQNSANATTCGIDLQSIFLGVILTATSVSITVETLRELGKLKTHSGNAILGAAIIDDIFGIVALTIVTSMADQSVNIGIVLLKILLFFVFAVITGFLFYKIYGIWCNKTEHGLHRHAIIAFVFCLLMSYCAEHLFGVADITGAFIAGIIISTTQKSQFLASKFDVLNYLYLSPIFFASIGLKVDLPAMSLHMIQFTIILVFVAMITKIIGCGFGAKLCRYKNYQAVRIGVGMISRGEVALIVASKGESMGLLNPDYLGPVILVVVITTIITPIILKPVFKVGPPQPLTIEPGFSNNYDQIDKYRNGPLLNVDIRSQKIDSKDI